MALTPSAEPPTAAARVLLLFIDGLGIGERTSANPLHCLGERASPLAVFANQDPELLLDGRLARTDANLGVEGRPQSASGQTTILTGTNASALLGRHKQGYPNRELRELIWNQSIFRQLQARGITTLAFANAYLPRFFTERPRWIAATTVAVEAAQMNFRTIDDLRAERALYHDYTNQLLIRGNYNVAPHTPESAAEVLARIVREHQFTLYEFFLTDRLGHAQDMDGSLELLSSLARFARALLARVNLADTMVIITSDHGNIEDLSVRNHTRNPVPTLVWGAEREFVSNQVRALSDIAPAILSIFN